MRSPAVISGKVFSTGFLAIALLVSPGCGNGKGNTATLPGHTDTIPRNTEKAPPAAFDSVAIIVSRQQKDTALRTMEGSPIPEAERGTFPGLRYYPPSRAMVFNLAIEKITPPEPVKMPATRGDVRTFHRYGRFSFSIDGTPCTLTAFVSDEHPTSLFVPFKDATNGSETYEVGRYIDLEETGDGHYVLDFNGAYNPYCAYNSAYTCPIVPAENILRAPIRAGEKLPATGSH
ncbi:MAG: hypothetical protein JWQ98_493 [Chlorobi bacterium]|nr:hypothetical protein [Chlorobiota bacterium]